MNISRVSTQSDHRRSSARFLFCYIFLCLAAIQNTQAQQQDQTIPHEGRRRSFCPPRAVSSPEEVGHYCHEGTARYFQVRNFTYECFAAKRMEPPICRGTIHPRMRLPHCSQPSIPNCRDETIYANFNNQSIGPCLYRADDTVWHSARCSEGRFQCFDVATKTWCGGQIEKNSTVLPEEEEQQEEDSPVITCPPKIVSSLHEAASYCFPSGLVARLDPEDSSHYACYWNNGTSACHGLVDATAVNVPLCSAPIESCNDHGKVCRTDLSTTIMNCVDDDATASFECWDKTLDQWCVGQIVRAMSVHKAYVSSTRDDSKAGSEHRWATGVMAALLASFSLIAILARKDMRKRHHPTSASAHSSSTVDRFAYRMVSENMDPHDLELSNLSR